MQNNKKEIIEKYALEKGISVSRVVLIDDVPYDCETSLTKDFITGEWVRIYEDNYRSYRIIERYDSNEGYIYEKTAIIKNRQDAKNLIAVYIHNNNTRDNAASEYWFLNKEELNKFCKENNFVLGKNRKVYFHISALKFDRVKPSHFNGIKSKKTVERLLNGSNFFPESKNWKKTKEYKELENHIKEDLSKFGLESKTFLSFEGLKYTFGVELETISGIFSNEEIQHDLIPNLNMSSVHDGSLRDCDGSGPWGAEYVTGVLVGDSGLKHLHDITTVLNKRCTVDKRTSVHVHIGSLKWNSEEIVYAYLLGKMLENEIFSIMPKSRNSNIYCKKLIPLNLNNLGESNFYKDYKKNIKLLYGEVFSNVSNLQSSDSCYNKKSVHPRGRHGGYDRDVDHRYSWLNFTNIIFNQRGNFDSKTIEFRCHSGTLSYIKIHNWIKICMAIVEYVHVGKKEIIQAAFNGEKITLNQIFEKVYPKSHDKLKKYISIRKNLFNDISNETVDYVNESSNIKNLKDIICV